jgi:hypothetical protein
MAQLLLEVQRLPTLKSFHYRPLRSANQFACIVPKRHATQIIENKRKLAHRCQRTTLPVFANGTALFEIEQCEK